MANNCYYMAKAIGSKEAVEEFARILAGEGEFMDDRLGRVSDFEATGAEKPRLRTSGLLRAMAIATGPCLSP